MSERTDLGRQLADRLAAEAQAEAEARERAQAEQQELQPVRCLGDMVLMAC